MSLHTCPGCGAEVATNSTTAGAFAVPPMIVCVDCGVEMNVDPDVTVDMDQVRP
jgi:predicted RNA-binding Zn-ribbon protein involved in translation (DUF1610 family)